MTGNQLQQVLDDAEFSQVGMAAAIQIGERSMRRHVKARKVPAVVSYAVRWVAHCAAKDLDPETGAKIKK